MPHLVTLAFRANLLERFIVCNFLNLAKLYQKNYFQASEMTDQCGIREMEYIECASFVEIYWSLVSLTHFTTPNILIFKSTQHLITLEMLMDLVFVLKCVKSVTGRVLYLFHLSVWNIIKGVTTTVTKYGKFLKVFGNVFGISGLGKILQLDKFSLSQSGQLLKKLFSNLVTLLMM